MPYEISVPGQEPRIFQTVQDSSEFLITLPLAEINGRIVVRVVKDDEE